MKNDLKIDCSVCIRNNLVTSAALILSVMNSDIGKIVEQNLGPSSSNDDLQVWNTFVLKVINDGPDNCIKVSLMYIKHDAVVCY